MNAPNMPKGLRRLVLFIFVSLVLLLPNVIHSNFVFFGLIFFEGAESRLILSFLFLAILFLLYFVFKKYKSSYQPLLIFYALLGINSAINLLASIIFPEDISGFMQRVVGSADFFLAFSLKELLLSSLCATIILYAWANKNIFSRR